MLFRAEEAEIIDTWKVAGMRGTGSHDIAVKDVFVPAEHSLDIFFGQTSVPGPLFRFPLLEFSLHIATVAVGIAQGALDDLVKFVGTKKQRLYARTPLAETPLVHYRLGYAETTLRAARAFLRTEAERVWQFAVTGAEVDSVALTTRILATDSWVAQTCAAIVDTCYTVGGGSSVYESSPLQRRLRDIHTLTQHASLSENTFTRAGATLVGQPPIGFSL
jgi:alkylation response protein AidB-like acyl-CoA dehydrogenase